MKPFILLISAFLVLPAIASDFTTKSPDAPRIPAREFSASAFGVTPNSAAPVTDALQKAIDQVVAKGGGTLTLAPGTYLVGPLKLASRLHLHLPAGVILRLLPRDQNYPQDDKRYANLFSAVGATDLRISGRGKIDGQGEPWWNAYRAGELKMRRPQIVALEGCDRVELLDFTIVNPPNGHVALRLCRDVTIRGVKLEAPDDSANTDGFNISGKNYLIENCDISTGDDNIVILTHSTPRDWSAPTCENFIIRDNRFGFGHGLSLGSYTGGGIRNVLAERITMDGTTSGIRMKASRDRGGPVENIIYRDITMRGVKNPVFISSYYPREPRRPGDDEAKPVTETTPRWDRILIENLKVTESQNSLILWGLPELPLGLITLRNASFESRNGAKLYYAPTVTLDRVTVSPESGPEFDYWPSAEKK